MKVRIAFKARTSVGAFDPARIQLDTEAVVLDNLYSPLVRFGNDGAIEPAAAERFFWEGDALVLPIRPDLTTADGEVITAQDASLSLLRLMVDRRNAHGDLQTLLCPGAKIRSVADRCEGMEVRGSALVLTVARPEYRPFLLQLLANMDFGIIPASALDSSRPMPRIRDYRKTSGPYFVEKDSLDGAFVLRRNPNHWLAGTGIPEVLEFHPTEAAEAIRELREGRVDFVPTIHVEPSEELNSLRGLPGFTRFETQPIRKLLIATTREQLGEFTAAERHAIYQLVRREYFRAFASWDWKPSIEFFPAFGEGSLSPGQRAELDEAIRSSEATKIHRLFTLGVSSRRRPVFEKILGRHPLVRLVEIKTVGPFMPRGERPDFYATGIDSGFYESVNLISANIATETFDLSPDEGREWIARYMSQPQKEDRLAMLRELHLDSLKKGLIGVIGEAPYIAVGRKPFRYEGSKFFAGSPLWQIRQD